MIEANRESMREAFRWAYPEDDGHSWEPCVELDAVLRGDLLHVTPFRGEDDDRYLAIRESQRRSREKRASAYWRESDFEDDERCRVMRIVRSEPPMVRRCDVKCHFCHIQGSPMAWIYGGVGLCMGCARKINEAGEMRDTIKVLQDMVR